MFSFGWGIFGHAKCSIDQSCASKNIWWTIISDILQFYLGNIFGHVMYWDQLCTSKILWWIIMAYTWQFIYINVQTTKSVNCSRKCPYTSNWGFYGKQTPPPNLLKIPVLVHSFWFWHPFRLEIPSNTPRGGMTIF